MKSIEMIYKNSALVSESDLAKAQGQLEPEIAAVAKAVQVGGYGSDYASVNAPFDQARLTTIKALVEEKKQLKPTALVVIGIGGSNLGALAVYQALNGCMYNQMNPVIKVYWADTVDSDYISQIIACVERELKQGNNVLLNVVSKSGSTTETIANFEIFLELLKKYKPNDYAKYVIATTDKDSKLWQLAQQAPFAVLEIPKKIGGRFSVFSAAGLFPLGLLSVDLDALLKGAADMVDQSTQKDNNPAALSAAIIFEQSKQGKTIHDTFLFAQALEGVGKWYRQLVGESLGKDGKGMTPTVSMGSVDLHSVAQLYLGGPNDKVTTFIEVDKNKTNVAVPDIPMFDALVPNIQGKPLSSLMDAILNGTQKAYQNNRRPFVVIQLPEISAYTIGQLLQMKMIEIMYLGFLLEVNPFDQPHVELYKKETRKILSHE